MKKLHLLVLVLTMYSLSVAGKELHDVQSFNQNWKFTLADSTLNASANSYNDNSWRSLNLPHDWSIESDFGKDFPASPGGGALPGGLGWYRKSFTVDKAEAGRRVYIDFDGVYRNSEVWINGTSVGKRPYGYISFRYDLTPYIRFGEQNVIAVKVDNLKQPNSRWYSGSGIFRNVWLTILNPVHVDHWGTYVTTPQINADSATIAIQTTIKNDENKLRTVRVEQLLYDAQGLLVSKASGSFYVNPGTSHQYLQQIVVKKPLLWNIENPYQYKLVTRTHVLFRPTDEYVTQVGIRSFTFDVKKGFILNGKRVKINGVCNHHDLGALGAAVNTRAIERQLQILKDMGCNGIRCSHNPPAPELLDLCDKMGFIVMDEAFDMWLKKKVTYDYSLDFPEWHERDLTDLIVRDRNHPSVFIWSIGNEVGEQWGEAKIDDTDLQKANVQLNNRKISESEDTKLGKLGKNALLTRHLADIVKNVDPTRPVSAACNGTDDKNPLFLSGALDMIGFNYHEGEYAGITKRYPDKPFFSSESVSALQTRGFYLMPSDSMNIWPESWDKPFFNPLQKCSAYDNSHAPWGSTHEATWKIVKKYDHIAGQYIWTGFDYLGEPTPYWWPSRSSYFGIIDLAGFPKDVYYMYQSEWTNKDVLYIFPHWNWKAGQAVDVWAYYNNADEVELYLNGQSLGKRSKAGDDLHVMWRIKYEPGTLKAVSRKNGKEVLTRDIKTAGVPASIRMIADRPEITADGKDLSFVTVELIDKDGNAYPLADQLVKFTVEGEGAIVGTDNGDQNEHASLKKPERKLFYGKCLAIVQNTGKPGKIVLKASVEGMPAQEITIVSK
ncbi:MAG: glycoside hydrolase family 2 TIM barrel-domain containing protein [Paludibacter sp.]|nr:glycoside hydrolase family 2 TIM barrel-domain containing protein [Paludibacter sp.]